MANKRHLTILKERVWNEWREKNPKIRPDLAGADLTGHTLMHQNLRRVNLRGARLELVNFVDADLSEADLREASFIYSWLESANLAGADLRRANLSGANLIRTNLTKADLRGVNLTGACLVETNFEKADLRNSRIYGASAWKVKLEGAKQSNLIITDFDESTIKVDDLEVGQFIYLLLNNKKIRNVIDTVTSKAVLILGRFTDERKTVLEALRADLRQRGYLPIIFDFNPSASRDLTETIALLARLSRFIIADLTDPKSIPQELTSIIPELPSVPVQPIILRSQREYSMYEHWRKYPWVLPIHRYDQIDNLLSDLPRKVIAPAEVKARELTKR